MAERSEFMLCDVSRGTSFGCKSLEQIVSADVSRHLTLNLPPCPVSPQACCACPWLTWTGRPGRTTLWSSRPRTWAASWGGWPAPPRSTSRSATSTTTRPCLTRVRDPQFFFCYTSSPAPHVLPDPPEPTSPPSDPCGRSVDSRRADEMFSKHCDSDPADGQSSAAAKSDQLGLICFPSQLQRMIDFIVNPSASDFLR